MTAPVRVDARETDAQRLARIRGNLQRLREAGAPDEAIQQYVQMERITPEMEMAAMPLSTGEKVGGAGRALYQGASFNFGDELMGAVRGITDDFGSSPGLTIGEGIADERTQLDAFRTAHPKTALGLELGGGLATGIGAAKALGGAPRAILASGVGGGAIAGAGAGEGVAGRLVGAGLGATIGAGLGAAGSAIANSAAGRAAGRGSRSLMDFLATQAGNSGNDVAGLVDNIPPRAPQQYPGMDAPKTYSVPAQRAASRAFGSPENFNAQRSLLDELERQGMGADALAMNVGNDQTVRAVRAAANQPGSTAGQTVNERLARQGGALGEAVPADIGTVTGMGGTPGPVRLREMQDELSGKVAGAYRAFRELGDIGPLPLDDQSAKQFERFVSTVRRNPELGALPPTDARVQAEAFHLLQEQVRRSNRGESAVTTRGLKELRDRVLEGLESVDPEFGRVTRQYALDADAGKVVQDAFATGMGLPGKPVGTATVALGETTDAGQKAMQAGHVTALQQRAGERASNADLGDLAQFRDVARAAVGTPAARQQFIELHGQEQYDALLARLRPKIQAAAQNLAARGNSTTAKQLLDALAFGDDATLDALTSLAGGSPASAARRFVGQKLVGPLDRAYRLGTGQTAGETADILTTRGTGNIRSLLDMLEELGQADAARRAAVAPVTGAVGRTVTPEMRGNPR